MKTFNIFTLMIAVLAMMNISCCSNKAGKSETQGGACEYSKYEGYAVIKSIKPAPASDYNCPDNPQKIIFDFTPLNISDRKNYRFTNRPDSGVELKINDGANPSLAWVKKNGITTGKKFKCFRTELKKGTCTPVVFTFPELNLFPENGCK